MLSGELAQMLNTPTLRQALEICDEVSPANGGMKDWKEPHTALIQLGCDRGYNLYSRVLRSLALPLKVPGPQSVEATYEGVDEEKEE